MTEALSVLFKVGRLPHMTRPEPAAIERTLRSFLHETLGAAAIGANLGLPAGTSIRYEVRWLDDIVETSDRIPFHLSVRGPRHLAEQLHDKLKAGLVDGGWTSGGVDFAKYAGELGIPLDYPVDFKLYVRSPTGEKFNA